MQMASEAQGETPEMSVFLPDLCGVNALFMVVIVSELVALLIVVAGTGFGARFFNELALVSLYTQWLGLSSASVLCVARRQLARADERVVAAVSFVLVVAVAWAVAELAWWVVNPVVGAGALIDISRLELIARTVSIAAIVAVLVLRYFYVQFHWKQRIASEARARLDALQARIRPHFFFNCMNSIASLTRSEPALAERAVEDLADLFRASLADARTLVPVREELTFVERYLSIESLRLGSRLEIKWRIEAVPDSAQLPLLTLQPIVENAIYHGIEPAAQGGVVEIDVAGRDGEVVITVTNPVRPDDQHQHRGNRIALDNVRQRLAAHFGEAARLAAGPEGGRYVVRITVPADLGT